MFTLSSVLGPPQRKPLSGRSPGELSMLVSVVVRAGQETFPSALIKPEE